MKPSGLLAYGLFSMPLAFAALPLYLHIPHFYAHQSPDLTLSLLGIILLTIRLFDAALDPWIGSLADRINRGTLMFTGLLTLSIGLFALFNPPSTHVVTWLVLSLLLTSIGHSAATIAYQALGTDITDRSDIRTRLTAAREGFGLVGILLAAALPSLLATNLDESMARMSWVFIGISAVSALITGTQIRLNQTRTYTHESMSIRKNLQLASRDELFSRLLGIFVLNGIAAAIPATLFFFFVEDVLKARPAANDLLTLYFFSAIVSLPLWTQLAKYTGRTAAWLIGISLSIVGFSSAFLLSPGDLGAFTVICVACGAALGADLIFPAALAADLARRSDQAGTYFGIWNFFAKFSLALAAGLCLPLLAQFGYTPGGSAGLHALSATYALLPLLFKGTAWLMLWRCRHSLEVRL